MFKPSQSLVFEDFSRMRLTQILKVWPSFNSKEVSSLAAGGRLSGRLDDQALKSNRDLQRISATAPNHVVPELGRR
jgi:hypothetical protein